MGYHAGTVKIFREGNWVLFEDGTKARIKNVEFDTGEGSSWTITVDLDIEESLSEAVNGSLLNIVVLDEDGNECPRGYMSLYKSQYGLQGRLVRKLAFIGHNEMVFSCLHWLCSIMTDAVLFGIVHQIYIKYDVLMAVIYYVVFLLSPWIVNFARNTYWLEFLWFIPMLIGLVYIKREQNERGISVTSLHLLLFS